MLYRYVFQRGNSGDGCDLASTLCKYDLRKGDLFVLSWARVRQVRWGSISSELLWRCEKYFIRLIKPQNVHLPIYIEVKVVPLSSVDVKYVTAL